MESHGVPGVKLKDFTFFYSVRVRTQPVCLLYGGKTHSSLLAMIQLGSPYPYRLYYFPSLSWVEKGEELEKKRNIVCSPSHPTTHPSYSSPCHFCYPQMSKPGRRTSKRSIHHFPQYYLVMCLFWMVGAEMRSLGGL